ncbi:SdrD B-like domain-containing protein [Variovorax sp. J22R133]|uniref:SdrD B-like domain-containing protein n=1 Tax=Variovorax brevis TaxID=3053503 RepID=UPI002577C480|nr:SdrD B-like domain-containing protein [Variovorax sp. J22R133]MDM0116523.1 SdrD B-like domain-containing protein [Variovorax sp. J22R133]
MTRDRLMMQGLPPGEHPVAWLVVGCALVVASTAQAADTGKIVVAEAQIRSMDRVQAEQERLRAMIQAAPATYEDRFMEADAAPGTGAATEEEPPVEGTGFQAWSLESRAGFAESSVEGFGRQHAAEYGLRAEYRRETLNYGDVLLQLDARHLSGDPLADRAMGTFGFARERTGDRFTFRNIGFPITPNTFADTTVGDTFSDVTDGLSRNYRLSLGTTMVRGLSTRIFNSDWDLRAGSGQRGFLAGGPYPGFETTQGSMTWLGATRRLSDEWFVAGQIDRANYVPAYFSSFYTPEGFGAKNVSSWATSVGYAPKALPGADADFKVRTTLVGSQVTSATPGVQTGDSQGLFVEASARTGRFNHQFGAYAADPNLYFGDYALITGNRGAYWRVDHSTGRMNWGGGFDFERADSDSVSNLYGYTRTAFNGNFQYLLDRDTSVGANANLSRTRYDNSAVGNLLGENRSLYGNVFYQTRFFDLPRTRLNLMALRNEQVVLLGTAATGQELQWEQDWITGRYAALRPELTTTLGYARDQSSGVTRTYPTAGVQFRYWFDSGFSVTGNLRWTSQDSDLYTSRGLSGSLTAEKEIAPGWHFGIAANMNQARSAAIQTSLFGPQVYRSNDKTFYAFLRWDGSSGTAYQAAGVRSGAGSGSVSGRVFLDANRDGRQQAGENGAANVEVVLDGRYRATTDRDGRFEFPTVTTGRHQLTLTLDSVPLPWGVAGDSGVSVNVPLRGQATAEIPVIKVGE